MKIHGNTYNDVNHDGRYEPNRGDSRLAAVEVRLFDAGAGAFLGSTVTNGDGYYRFPGLPLGPVYRVEITPPPGMRPTTPVARELEPRDFSTFWCCSARADFGLLPGRGAPTPPVPPPPPPAGPGQPVTPPCCEVPTGRQVHLPILNYAGNANVCASIVEVQNIGAWPSKAILVVWGAPGFCPPQCAGPLKVECSGLLAPGSAWNFVGAQLPNAAKSGMVFSAPAVTAPDGSGDVFADRLCEALYHAVVGDCDGFRRFKKAFNELGVWQSPFGPFDFGAYPGAALAVEVVRKCPGDLDPGVTVTGGYAGLADEMLGAYDPVYGGYTFFAPLVLADRRGRTSWLYIQNGGIECSSVEIWFKAQGDCLRPVVCDVQSLAPGETYQFEAASCVGPDWVGNAWVRGSQPLSVVVDAVGADLLASYQASPGELKYSFAQPPLFSAGSQVLFGPLLYSEYQGWDATVHVQNLSAATAARVKVYFLDRAGGVVATVVDWICPNGSQAFALPVIAALPGSWVGALRIESQDWFAPGNPPVAAPNVAGVVHMEKYADVARTQALEAVAYTLLPEQRALFWQLGLGRGGLESGVGRIGIPSFFKDRGATGLTTELAVANVVPKAGATDFAILIYDQNGLVQSLCE
ncbi:MAG: SdrD B-like domain-containing protein, partial [Anaerolineae bacterium]